MKMPNGKTFLDALDRDDIARVEELLRADPMLASAFFANIDSALVYAAARSAPIAVLQWLLAKGANPNAMISHQATRIALDTGYAWHPSTPLLEAVRRERPDLVALLLKAGASPQTAVPDQEQHQGDSAVPTVTPKQLAYETGQADVVKMLIQSGDHDPIPLALALTRLLVSASESSWSEGIQMLDQALALYARDATVIAPFRAWFYRSPFSGAMRCLRKVTDWESRRLLGLSKNAGHRVVNPDGALGEFDEEAHLYAMRAAFVVIAMLEDRRADSNDLIDVAAHAVLLGDLYLKDTALRIDPDTRTQDQDRLGDALADALGRHVGEWNRTDTTEQVALHLGNSPDAARFVRDALELGAAVDKIGRLIVPETSVPAESGDLSGRESTETKEPMDFIVPSEEVLGYLAAGDERAARERRTVIYVTTRRDSELTTSSEENIQFGKASVTFPVGRKAGEAHSGRLFGLFGRRASIALEGALTENDSRNSGPLGLGRQVLLFVHGFKTTFDEAVLRIAQVAVDSGFQGPVIAFSWPSAGKLFGYGHDDAVVRMAAPVLRQTCIELCSRCGAGRVHVLAHSMGSLLLLDALVPGRVIASPAIKLGEVVFAAPDVDREAFEVTVPMLETHAIAQRVTVYASRDRALALSKLLRLRRPRAGDSVPPPPVNGERHDTIDACKIRSDFVGHSEYGDNRVVHQDLFNLLVNHQGAAQRAYLKEHDYWVDLRAKCPDRVRMFRA